VTCADSERRHALAALAPPERLPTVVALAALWQEVCRRPLWAPPHFFRYLGLRRRARLELLDVKRLRLTAPPGKVNDCAACTDQCCIGKRSTVLLRLRDLAVLKDIDRTDLIASDKPRFSAEEMLERPALRRQVQSSAWQTFPVLAQNRFGACTALTSEGRCTLHPYWPLSCARFPYALHLDQHEIFYSRRCDAFWIRHDGATEGRVQAMAAAAVASYNERVKDLILLAYAPARLGELGLLQLLASPPGA
jgi:Fe-S-cluster containining protein